jgi:ABC-type iron transport system FetAB permease component
MTAVLAGSGSVLSGPVTLGDVALSVSLVVVAVGISAWQRLGLERDMTVATVRSFVQLIAVGYVLSYIFSGHGGLTVLAVAVMIGVASLTSRGRAKRVPWSGVIALASIAAATAATLGVLAALRIIPTSAQAVIPLGSMIISGAMNTTSLVRAACVTTLPPTGARSRRGYRWPRPAGRPRGRGCDRPCAAACSPLSTRPRWSAWSPCPEP